MEKYNWDADSSFGDEAVKHTVDTLLSHYPEAVIVPGPLKGADLIMKLDGVELRIEVKNERRAHITGNLFLEGFTHFEKSNFRKDGGFDKALRDGCDIVIYWIGDYSRYFMFETKYGIQLENVKKTADDFFHHEIKNKSKKDGSYFTSYGITYPIRELNQFYLFTFEQLRHHYF